MRLLACSPPRNAQAFPSSCMPISCRIQAARRLPPSSARFRPIISNMRTKMASPRWRGLASSRCCCPARIMCSGNDRRLRSNSCASIYVPMAVATDSNPGTSPMTSILLALNMAATLFGLTVDECLAGATRNAARALGLARRQELSKPANGPISQYGTSSVRRSLSIGSASTRCMRASGGDDDRRHPPRRGVARRLAGDLARRVGRR